ncbi:MAG: Polyribonucleotide nucleotidyltransferase [Candidatus Kaiserbacteria bacterium GW2011_GWB1_52_6]|uniref:Polyribonucleotide nucleotidyltransferase n=3 Tax=Candidatus Kaiseribacteriota TaxID=1752734 RepID=A0A0G1XKA6_9BACT|nr:MAG: Polyribonucleotide nucleotidyltransferase [Candidatus Kaiserbacteria bacterium GW2011_GWA2_52_12]KKW27621.1 MAG: Polyribonucleotide nucleotidyltransferase [Candidatus Kaiserbacteria bacterium GW2011_GWB1_52_6]KKW31653.1 MAG: Polyribonucleotide nucleotidyltransferase [Candidatus Kaiserbacteria bacterium GW2011_GWC2_52_8b]
MEKKIYSLDIGGKTMTAEFNDWADQAHGSVLLRYGNSTVLATVVMSARESEKDYFPLTVDYEEKFYAAGAILGSRFMRREGRPSDEAVLSGRIVDRTIRPLFPKGIKRDVQVIITVLSIDEYDTDVLAVNAASLAVATSNIPWNGPVSAMRIGQEAGSDAFIVNPTYVQRTEGVEVLDLLACGKDGLINMIEVGAKEVSEETLEKGLARASEEIEKIQAWQKKIIAETGKQKVEFKAPVMTPEMEAAFAEIVEPKLKASGGTLPKQDLGPMKSEWMKLATEKLPDIAPGRLDAYYEERLDAYVHDIATKEGKRVDGRAFDQIRPLFAQAGGISPIIHGSGLFYRGETHVLGALTLGGPGDAQLMDTIEYQETKKTFMLHYNFPPFSVGETGRVGGMNRRATGHGALAEKALRVVLPTKDVFPYTIRIVCESLASNGSTSMASVCAGTLALMDAGVPIKKPVAGIAMGMMSDAKAGVYKVLTDIQGPEDHHGDMDFKVAGTIDGVTAVQMDVKVEGVPLKVLTEAFAQAKKARMQILDVIEKEIPEPRTDISPRAPKILTTHVKVDQIGLVIGPGGKTINGIRERTLCDDITIEEDGTVFITGKQGTAEAALKEISDLTREYLVGDRFEGPVVRMMDFGAFVKISSNQDGLVHVSEVAPFRIEKISDAIKIGDVVPVVLKEIDEKGRYNLSIKAADPEWAAKKGLKPSTAGDYGRSNNNERRRRI